MMTTTPDGTKTRCDLLRSEMEKCIKEGYRDACLEEKDGKFLIVCFSSQCTFFPRDGSVCRFSNEKDVADAGYFINNMPVGGGTSMMLAWNRIVPLISSHEIQTVCFLSDGEPTDCNEQSLLSFLKQKVPNLRIHTFSMGGASSLLKNAAAQHKGIYREIF